MKVTADQVRATEAKIYPVASLFAKFTPNPADNAAIELLHNIVTTPGVLEEAIKLLPAGDLPPGDQAVS